jgi:hypothetical protein
MEHTKIVTPGELENYADRADSERVIPELISRLVSLSVPDLTLCRIPYGDEVGLPGLDGIIRTESGYRQFVPKQTSYWEMGRGERAQDKATEDYRKRTDRTPSDERASTAFVFVTPRSRDWDQSRQLEWLRHRQQDGWKELKILDGVQLCDWLREFPALGAWLLQRIGLVKSLTGFRTPVRSSKSPLGPPGERVILDLNPERRERILELTAWPSLYSGSLNLEVVTTYVNNANSLFDEALLLHAYNKTPRAAALTVLGLEELAKAPMLTNTFVRL